MKKKVLISRHIACEGPGYFAQFLQRQDIPYQVIKIDENESFPESLAEFSGLVFMGGSMSVNDNLPWISKALDLIQEAVAQDKPVLGHCLGGQLISKALGGVVGPNPVAEIGWLPVTVDSDSLARTWLGDLTGDLRPKFEVFHWHSETFSLPVGATRLLQSQHCQNQAFVLGKTLGLQCHIEMTRQMIADWIRLSPHEIALPAPTIQTAEQMQTNLDQRLPQLHRVADKLYSHWIKGLA